MSTGQCVSQLIMKAYRMDPDLKNWTDIHCRALGQEHHHVVQVLHDAYRLFFSSKEQRTREMIELIQAKDYTPHTAARMCILQQLCTLQRRVQRFTKALCCTVIGSAAIHDATRARPTATRS